MKITGKIFSANIISSSSSLNSEMSDHSYSPLPLHLSLWQTLASSFLNILQQLIFRWFYILCLPHKKIKTTLTVNKIGDRKVEYFAHGCTGALWIRHFSVAPEQYWRPPFPWAIDTKAFANIHESNVRAVLLFLPAAPPPTAKEANCSLSKSWHLSPSAFALRWRTQHLSFPALPSPSHPQSFVNYRLCERFYPVLFLTKLREEVSMLLQPSSNCLLNNPSLHPTDCFLWRETSILTNTADDKWNYKRAYWVN